MQLISGPVQILLRPHVQMMKPISAISCEYPFWHHITAVELYRVLLCVTVACENSPGGPQSITDNHKQCQYPTVVYTCIGTQPIEYYIMVI